MATSNRKKTSARPSGGDGHGRASRNAATKPAADIVRKSTAMPAERKSGGRTDEAATRVQKAKGATVARKPASATASRAPAGKAVSAGGKASGRTAAATTKSSSADKPPTAPKKTATKPALPKKTAAGKPSATKQASGKSVGSASGRASAAGSTTASRKRISAEQALANTRRLLDAKHAHEREAPPWQAFNQGANSGRAPQSGFQSDEARVTAQELHEDEIDLPAVQGNVSDRNRQRQGRRDHRTPNRQ